MKIMYAGHENSSLVREWVECAIQRGHEVIWASMHEPLTQEYMVNGEDVRIAFSPMRKGVWNWVKLYNNFKKVAKHFNPDIVHAHYLCDYGYLASHLKCPTIGTVMGSDVAAENMLTGQMTRLKRAAKHLTRVSVKDEFAKERLTELGAKPENIVIRPSFCDTRFFRRESKYVRDYKSLIFTRQWRKDNKYKQGVLLAAIPHIVKEFPNVNIFLVDWTSRGINAPDKYKKNITMLPKLSREQVKKFLNMSAIYVDTYYRKRNAGIGHGTTTIEAMSCECALVLPDREEYLNDRFYGLQYKQGNSKEMSETINMLLSKPFLVNHYGISNRQSAMKYYDREKVMSKIFNLYEELTNE